MPDLTLLPSLPPQSVALKTPPAAILSGTAVPAERFLLIETPQPWTKPALLSEGVPEALRQVLRSQLVSQSGLRVHLIADEQTAHRKERRVLLFQRPRGLARSYCGYSQVVHPDQLAGVLADVFQDFSRDRGAAEVDGAMPKLTAEDFARAGFEPIAEQRHLVVCTHASHNQCCGLLGYPFYQAAIARVRELGMLNTQIWQVSHIGGHRFAPTLIDLPQGRYYGNLDQAALDLLLQQQGDLSGLLDCYRGWSLLSKPLQILEAHLWRQQGWPWLEQAVTGRSLKQSGDATGEGGTEVELISQMQRQPLRFHRAQIANQQIQRYRRLRWNSGLSSEVS